MELEWSVGGANIIAGIKDHAENWEPISKSQQVSARRNWQLNWRSRSPMRISGHATSLASVGSLARVVRRVVGNFFFMATHKLSLLVL